MKQIFTITLLTLFVSCNNAASKENLQRDYDSVVNHQTLNSEYIKLLKDMSDDSDLTIEFKRVTLKRLDSAEVLQNSLNIKRIELAKKLFQKE